MKLLLLLQTSSSVGEEEDEEHKKKKTKKHKLNLSEKSNHGTVLLPLDHPSRVLICTTTKLLLLSESGNGKREKLFWEMGFSFVRFVTSRVSDAKALNIIVSFLVQVRRRKRSKSEYPVKEKFSFCFPIWAKKKL